MQTRRYTHFISNQETSAFSDKVIVRSSPATGRLVAEFGDGSTEDAQTAIAAARKAFDEGPWPKLSGVERGNLLFALATRLREEKERLAQIECAEVGKPIKFARGDVEGAIAAVNFISFTGSTVVGRKVIRLGQYYDRWISSAAIWWL
jgi:betaine-aldehyde dehydrogenase